MLKLEEDGKIIKITVKMSVKLEHSGDGIVRAIPCWLGAAISENGIYRANCTDRYGQDKETEDFVSKNLGSKTLKQRKEYYKELYRTLHTINKFSL